MFWDFQSRHYEQESREYAGLHLRILEKTRTHLKDSDKVLDYGCATGKITCELASHAKEIHGLDFSRRMIAAATTNAAERRIENVEFEQATIFDQVYPEESFDLVLALGVLHLLKDPPRALERVNALLRPGGLFVSSTACMEDDYSVLNQINRFASLLSRVGILPYMRFFKIPELEASIIKAGFQILETETLPFDNGSDEQYVVARFVAARKAQPVAAVRVIK
jgi:2-polyprenyl-3-methyl-5-hydroxy-6-metoxy-1,4-benzoquinol methylase